MFVGEKLVFEMRDSVIPIKSKSMSSFVRSAWSWSKFFEREQTLWWNIERLFDFMLPGRLQKYSGSLYLLLTFKELVSSLLESSVKLLRFLIKWKSSLWWKRFVGVVIVSLAFPCLLQKGYTEPRVRCTFKHFIVKFIKIITFDMNPIVTVITENCHVRSFNTF